MPTFKTTTARTSRVERGRSPSLRIPLSGKYPVIDQSQPCYHWTFDLFPLAEQPRISLDEAQMLVQHVWFFYRGADPAPMVRDVPDRESASGSRWVIRLPRWGLCRAVVLHEVAHALGLTDTGELIHEGYEGHGPLYMALVIDLYAMFMGVSRERMIERAVHFGVQVGN